MFSQEFLDEMKARLLETKNKLQEDLSGLSAHTEVGDDLDEAATELQMDEVNQDVISQMKSDLEKIDLALSKIEDGSYGLDQDGNPIREERLRVLPWAQSDI